MRKEYKDFSEFLDSEDSKTPLTNWNKYDQRTMKGQNSYGLERKCVITRIKLSKGTEYSVGYYKNIDDVSTDVVFTFKNFKTAKESARDFIII